MAFDRAARVRLTSVTKRYGARVVLRDLDLAMPPARLVTVDGANGSGKSTLLRLVAGVARPTSGTVAGLPDRIGYLPERFDPPGLMRTDAYLRHVGRMAGLSSARARAATAAMLELLDVRPGPHHRLGALSKGNLQKVGLAQSFLAPHDLVVLDEPRTALETSAWPLLDRLVAEAVDRGALVVSADHDPGVLARAAHRVQVHDGSVTCRTGAPPAPAGPTHFRVRAYPLAGSTLPRADLVGELPMVVVEGDDAAGLSLLVTAEDKDAVLLRLLRSGWSIAELVPDDRA